LAVPAPPNGEGFVSGLAPNGDGAVPPELKANSEGARAEVPFAGALNPAVVWLDDVEDAAGLLDSPVKPKTGAEGFEGS